MLSFHCSALLRTVIHEAFQQKLQRSVLQAVLFKPPFPYCPNSWTPEKLNLALKYAAYLPEQHAAKKFGVIS